MIIHYNKPSILSGIIMISYFSLGIVWLFIGKQLINGEENV